MAQAFPFEESQNQKGNFDSKESIEFSFEQHRTILAIDPRAFYELHAARHEKIGKNFVQAFTSDKPIDNL